MAEAEQTRKTSGESPLPLWVTIGDPDLADGDPDPQESQEGAYIGEYPTDRALQSAVEEREHPLREYILAAIEEVRRGVAPSSETGTAHERGAKDAS